VGRQTHILRFRGTAPTRATLPLITGLNDSGWSRGLRFGQAQILENFYPALDGSVRTSPGREYIKQSIGSGSDIITGVVCPPRKIPLLTLNSRNNSLYFHYQGTDYTATLTTGNYYTYDELAAELRTALNDAVHGSSHFQDITGVTTGGAGSGEFKVAGDLTASFEPYHSFYIINSTANDGEWTISAGGPTYDSGSDTTTIPVDEAVSDGTVDGQAAYMYWGHVRWDPTDWNAQYAKKFVIYTWVATSDYIYWHHDNTTLDPTVFGFRWSAERGANPYIVGEWKVDSEPPLYGTKKGVFTNNKFYDQDGTEITLPSGSSIETSEDDIAGVWDNDRFYFCNGEKNYVMRDRFLRQQPPNDWDFQRGIVHDYTVAGTPFTATTFHNTASANTHIDMDEDTDWMRLPLGGGAADMSTRLVDTATLILSKPSEEIKDWRLDVYYEVPSLGIKHFIKSVYADDVSDDNTAPTTVTLIGSTDAVVPAVSSNVTVTHYLLLNLKVGQAGSGTCQVHYNGGGAGDYIYTIDSNGDWDATANRDWCGTFISNGENFSGAEFSFGYTLENAEGFETQLVSGGQFVWDYQGASVTTALTVIPIEVPEDTDFAYINVYRTTDGGSVYYRMAHIPRIYLTGGWFTTTSLTVYGGVDDTRLAAQAQAPSHNALTQINHTTRVQWQGRTFGTGRTGYENLLDWTSLTDSGLPAPEHWNTTSNWAPVGKAGLPNTALAPLADRLLIFQRDHIHVAIPGSDGESFPIEEISDKGVGTLSKDSPVSVLTAEGYFCFFQAQNGHFYLTDGIHVRPLSFGNKNRNNLSTLVSTMNLDALDKTRGIYVPAGNYIIWMICTGANTTPNKAVLFHLDPGIFSIDTMAANYLAIESAQVNDEADKIVGAVEDDLIYVREDDSDDLSSGNGITATWKSWAMDFGDQWGVDMLIDAIVTAKAQQAATAQEMTLNIYPDEAVGAQKTCTWELTTSVRAQKIGCQVASKVMEFEITTNTAALGWAAFDELAVKVDLQQTGVRRTR